MKCFRTVGSIFLSASIFLATPSLVVAQTPDEHAKHHPKQATAMGDTGAGMGAGANTKDTGSAMSGGGTSGGAAAGGIGGGMGEMMKEMGVPPRKELYPSLMQLPAMSPEQRNEIKGLADERVNEGNRLLSLGLEKLRGATNTQDFVAMQAANEQIRQGQGLIKSGMAAQQALAENKDARATALQWFKGEMNLAPAVAEQPHGFFGLNWFHYITMISIAAFVGVMIWMYFHKMQRANALVAKLTGSATENIPLPGTATPSAPLPVSTPPLAVNPEIAPTKSNSWSGPLVVSAIFDETPSVKTFRLTDPESGKLPFNYLPGQFITVTIVVNGVPVKRSYTIASSPTLRDSCEITVKHEELGTVSHYLHTQVHEGDTLQLTGPSGKFTFTGQEAKSIVLIGGGVGVTPVMSVIRYLTDRSWKGEIYFFFSCRDESNIIFREEIGYLKKRFPNLHVFIILSEQSSNPDEGYLTGRLTKEVLSEHVPEISSRRVHICGPTPMMDAVKKMLDELHVPKENIFLEIFPGKPPTPKTAPLPPQEAGKTAAVTFAKSNKTAVLTPDKTILEASEDVGVNIEYSCRSGTCGICKTRLLVGKVTMEVEDALTEDDKAHNIILACQAKATEAVAVDA